MPQPASPAAELVVGKLGILPRKPNSQELQLEPGDLVDGVVVQINNKGVWAPVVANTVECGIPDSKSLGGLVQRPWDPVLQLSA